MTRERNHDEFEHDEVSDLRRKFDKAAYKILWWLIGVVVMACGSIYKQTVDRMDGIETKVQFLYQDKASREELRQSSLDIQKKVDENKHDILQQQDGMKRDILQRLDYLLRILPSDNHQQNNR